MDRRSGVGLVWGVSHLEHDSETQEYGLVGVPWADDRHLEFDPCAMPAIHINKV